MILIILFHSILDVKNKYIQWVNIFLYFWIAITLAVSVIDLALGILFGVDYDRVMVSFSINSLLEIPYHVLYGS